MTKICYLDFDGVLHDEHVYIHPKRGIYIRTAGRVLFEWMPILDDLLAPYPDVRIVLSTSWVRTRGFNFARKQLSPALKERVIGATFHRRFMRRDEFAFIPRGVQIADDVLRREPDAWFAVDDDYLGWPPSSQGNLVQTDGSLGISDPAVQKKIKQFLERF